MVCRSMFFRFDAIIFAVKVAFQARFYTPLA